ncbi:hypothetical protein C7M84_004329 [Penaeus vannamei]|uniref:Uncharacterized protein n=1 Tax=Penaeus vannamei TaxID=6689 RepID=A0A3R7MHZ3_PENVA|nr:hypothetical protein C7M84_004329 [Penaeus vannamei]
MQSTFHLPFSFPFFSPSHLASPFSRSLFSHFPFISRPPPRVLIMLHGTHHRKSIKRVTSGRALASLPLPLCRVSLFHLTSSLPAPPVFACLPSSPHLLFSLSSLAALSLLLSSPLNDVLSARLTLSPHSSLLLSCSSFSFFSPSTFLLIPLTLLILLPHAQAVSHGLIPSHFLFSSPLVLLLSPPYILVRLSLHFSPLKPSHPLLFFAFHRAYADILTLSSRRPHLRASCTINSPFQFRLFTCSLSPPFLSRLQLSSLPYSPTVLTSKRSLSSYHIRHALVLALSSPVTITCPPPSALTALVAIFPSPFFSVRVIDEAEAVAGAFATYSAHAFGDELFPRETWELMLNPHQLFIHPENRTAPGSRNGSSSAVNRAEPNNLYQ